MTSYTVYILIDKDDKVYVGVTSQTVKHRWNNGNGYRCIPNLWLAIESQGWESFRKEIVAEGLSKPSASNLEQELIKQYDSTNPTKGYNRDLGGVGKYKKVSPKTRNKIRYSLMGERNPNFGKHFSKEHRSKIAKSNRGQTRSFETRVNLGKAHEKPVAQYSLDGRLIAVFESGKKASITTGIQAGHISKVCKHQRATAGGYTWCYN